MSTKDTGINTKTVRIRLPKIEDVELKGATVDLEKGVVVVEYGEKEVPFEAKKGDFLTLKTDPSKVVIFEAMAGVFGGVNSFTIIYDLPTYINGVPAYTLKGVKMPISRFRHSTEEEKAIMIEEMEKLGKRYNPRTFEIEDMIKEESIKKLEVGKDYINVHDNSVIVIDRTEDMINRGFGGGDYKHDLSCMDAENWREATEEEVIEAFKKHLINRYGKDWETMKIKEKHPDLYSDINDSSWFVAISKNRNGWSVWNENGLLYCDGIWVERLEEELKISIQDAIKANTIIHCEPEEEAKRILGMAHKLGYKWCTGDGYKNNTLWRDYREETCYNIFDGSYGYVNFYESYKQIIPSTQIADLEEAKSTDWTTPPKDIEHEKIKVFLNADKKRYEVIKTVFSDFKQLSLGDNKTNKIIAHFVNQDEDTLLLAEKIADILNLMEK